MGNYPPTWYPGLKMSVPLQSLQNAFKGLYNLHGEDGKKAVSYHQMAVWTQL